MKKIRLVGKKLYRVGPLKCYKDNHHGHGSGGTYSSSRPQGYGSGSGGGTYMGSDRGRGYKESVIRREAIEKKRKEDLKKKVDDALKNDPTVFRSLLDSPDEETRKAAEAAAQAEEDKKTSQVKKDIIAKKKIKNLLKKNLPNVMLDVAGLGVVNLASALASEISPEKKAQIIKSIEDNVPGAKEIKAAFAQETETASDAEVQAALDSGEYDNPDNPNVYSGSPRTQQAQRESRGGDKFTPPLIANVQVAKTVVDAKAEEGPKTPGQMSEAELTAMLEKRARGEDSLVEREAKIARDRGLAQQLATVRGARGVTAGQRLRALQRGAEKTERVLQPEIAAAKAREQQSAQDALLALKRGDRLRAEKIAREDKIRAEKAAAGRPARGGGGGGGLLGKIQKGVNLFKTGKKLFSGLFQEGGFVSGPGTETSDSIPARLSDGEFVVKASAVRGIGKAMGAKGEGEERTKGVDFLYKLQDRMDKVEKREEGGEIKADPERFLKFMDKGVSHSLMKKRIQKARIPKEEKEKLLKGLGEEPKFSEGGEAYSRPKKAFREAIGYKPESRFHDKAFKDTKHGGARRKFRHFQDGGPVDMKGPGMVKEQFKVPSAGGFGSVVAAQADLQRRIEELERKMGK